MTVHDWQPVYEGMEREADQCKNCGVIRLVVRWHKEPFTRYSRPHANINHCLSWYRAEPPCEAPGEPDRTPASNRPQPAQSPEVEAGQNDGQNQENNMNRTQATGSCRFFCPEHSPCALSADVQHELHIRGNPNCACHGASRYQPGATVEQPIKWTQTHPPQLAKGRFK